MSDVVVVESPAKAKTINRYLGGGFTVLASLGHVRDLPPKDGSVRPDQDFAMDWTSDARGEKQVGAIAKALKGADTLYLATDPDRDRCQLCTPSLLPPDFRPSRSRSRGCCSPLARPLSP